MSGTGILGACQVHHVRKGAIHELHPPHVWIDRILLHHANDYLCAPAIAKQVSEPE